MMTVGEWETLVVRRKLYHSDARHAAFENLVPPGMDLSYYKCTDRYTHHK